MTTAQRTLQAQIIGPNGFLFLLKWSHKNTISTLFPLLSCLYKCRSHLETKEELRKFGDLALTSLFWWHKFSLINSFCGLQSLRVQYCVQQQVIFPGNKQPNTPETSFGGHGQPTEPSFTYSGGVFMTYQCWDCQKFESTYLPLKTKVLFDGFGYHTVNLLFRKTSANSHRSSFTWLFM